MVTEQAVAGTGATDRTADSAAGHDRRQTPQRHESAGSTIQATLPGAVLTLPRARRALCQWTVRALWPRRNVAHGAGNPTRSAAGPSRP